MLKPTFLPFAILVALLLPACLDSPPAAQDGSEAPAGSGETPPPDARNSPRPPQPTNRSAQAGSSSLFSLALNECESFHSAFRMPSALNPGSSPDGWANDRPAVESAILYWLYSCERLGLGQVERGPASILIESHTNYNTRNNCTNVDGARLGSVGHHVYSNDPFIVEYLDQTLGIPATHAEVSREGDVTGPAESASVSWSVGSSPVNQMTFRKSTDEFNGETESIDLVAFVGDGVARIRVDVTKQPRSLQVNQGEGAFYPPMLIAQLNEGPTMALQNWYPTLHGAVHFDLFEDALCEQLSYSTL